MTEEIVELLKRNNELLGKLVKHQEKADKAARWKFVLQMLIQLLPFIILAALGWWVYSLLMENIAALQGNIDALKEGFANVWDGVTFWD